MQANPSLFQAFAAQKCPQCRKGNMFKHNMYNILKFGEPNTTCSHCGLRFEREPGFFVGAMYFSYAINVAIIVTVGVGLNIFFDLSIYTVMAIVIATVIIAVPFTYRYSRMLMMYLFSGAEYNPDL